MTYVRADAEARPLYAITKYMHQMHGCKPGATRQMLYVLCRAGELERAPGHFYRIAPGDSGRQLSLNEAAALTTTLG